MRSMKIFVFIVATLLVVSYVSAGISHGGCPPPSKVYNDKRTCFSDSDCSKWGQVCCPNQRNTKSCVDRAPWSNADSNKKDTKYSGVGTGRDNRKSKYN